MKSNHILRKFLLVAILNISFCPADSSYAIDPDSCDSIILEPFLDAILQRVSTIAKFVSLNLGNSNRRDPAKNPQGWSYDGYVQTQVELLMGGAWDALSEAQWVFGGAQGTQYAGIPSIAFTKIDKNQARPNDVVLYCNVKRLSAPNAEGYVCDEDSNKDRIFNGNTATNSDAIFHMSQVELCSDDWQEGAPAYVFWQVNLDAARISFCGWYLKEVMENSQSDLRVLTEVLQRMSAGSGQAALWSLPRGPPGTGQIGRPSVQNFQMIEAVMTLALTHTSVMGYRKFTQQDNAPSGITYGGVTWAGAVTAATSSQPSGRYPSEAFMFLMLDIFAYRSGFQLDNFGQFSAKSGAVTGSDWGNPGQSWALAWRPPFGQDLM